MCKMVILDQITPCTTPVVIDQKSYSHHFKEKHTNSLIRIINEHFHSNNRLETFKFEFMPVMTRTLCQVFFTQSYETLILREVHAGRSPQQAELETHAD